MEVEERGLGKSVSRPGNETRWVPSWYHAVMAVMGSCYKDLLTYIMFLCIGTRQSTGSWSSTMYDTCIHSTSHMRGGGISGRNRETDVEGRADIPQH